MASFDAGDLVLQATESLGKLKLLCNYEDGMPGDLHKVHGKHKFEAGKIPVLGSPMCQDRHKTEDRVVEVLGALETTGHNWIDRADVAKLSAKVNSMDELIYEKRKSFREMLDQYELQLRTKLLNKDFQSIVEVTSLTRAEFIDFMLLEVVHCFGTGSKQADYWRRIQVVKDQSGKTFSWARVQWALSFFKTYDDDKYDKKSLAYRGDTVHLDPGRRLNKNDAIDIAWDAMMHGAELPKIIPGLKGESKE